MMRVPTASEIKPPTVMNITIFFGVAILNLALLSISSHGVLWIQITAAVAFSFSNNTMFSLLHEAVHRTFARKKSSNYIFGVLSGVFFPTSYTFQRAMHLGHHRRNRTDAEMFDMYYPDDNLFLKYTQWYGLLTGFYWVLSPLACIVCLISPSLLRPAFIKDRQSQKVWRTGAEAMLSGLDHIPWMKLRGEVLVIILIHSALFVTGIVTWQGWALCYGAFALNWCALQYADHAWTPRQIRDGAWNLKVNPLVRKIFLNYHLHKAHHQHPNVPWSQLPRFVTDPQEQRPSFLSIYLQMWRGLRKATEPSPSPLDAEFEDLLFNGEMKQKAAE